MVANFNNHAQELLGEPGHQLELALRGNTIEVAYDCGVPGSRAEKQFVFSADTFGAAVDEVRQFLQRFCAGQTVVVRQHVGRIARAIRRDDVTQLAWFRSLEEVKAKPGQYVAIHTWSAIPSSGGGSA